MAAALIVEDGGDSSLDVARALIADGHTVHLAHSRDDALSELRKRPVDVVVCDESMARDLCSAAPSSTVVTLLSRTAGPATGRHARTTLEAIEEARRAIGRKRGFQGSVTGVPLVEVLQMFNASRRTISLLLDGATAGRIEFDRGEVVHAETGEMTGVPAFRYLLVAPGGRFRSSSTISDRRTIDTPFDQLVMQCFAFADPAGDSCDEIEGLDELRSWCPAPTEASMSAMAIPAPPRVPECALAAANDSPIVQRWDDAQRSIGPDAVRGLVVAIDRVRRTHTVLAGAVSTELLEGALALLSQIEGGVCSQDAGTFEFTDGDTATAIVWRDGDVLLLADSVAARGAAWFRARTAAVARHVLAPVEITTGASS